MRIGIVVAVKTERAPFEELVGKPTQVYPSHGGFDVTRWDFDPIIGGLKVFLIRSEVGEIAAANATQYLICHHNVDKIINYGVAGGLSEDVPAHTVGYVKKIIHHGLWFGPGFKEGEYPYQGGIYITPKEDAINVEALGIREFICASGDRVILGGEPKINLRRSTGADICEMEAAAIARTCNRNGVPVSFIKAVSDGVDEDEDAFNANVRQASKACAEIIVRTLKLPIM